MKFYIFVILTVFFFGGCEKDFDTSIEPQYTAYQVTFVSNFTNFTYVPGDSVFTINLIINTSKDIRQVYFNVFSPDGEQLNGDPIIMYDDGNNLHGDVAAGDNIFSNRFPMSVLYPNGSYHIEYFITDIYNKTLKAAIHNFTYDNGLGNVAPVIFNPAIEPDTVVAADTVNILINLAAADSNGRSDIELVYFVVYRPNGTTSGTKNELFDDGNTLSSGDTVAGDGIYSRIIFVDQNNMKGTYRFEFAARDRGKKISNIISYNVLIQ